MRTVPLIPLAALSLLAATAATAGTELRMATQAPDGGTWMKILGKGASEVETKSSQRLRVKYYAGGVQGDERDVVRKINLGQLDGGVLTAVGLSMIYDGIRVLELPRLFATDEELDYVADKVWPYFQQKFEAKGFRLEDRGEVGWIHFVSKSELKSLDTLKSLKVWLLGDDAIVRALYKQLGVSGVPLVVAEVEPALTTGRVEAAYGAPLDAVARQWSSKVKFMTSMPLGFGVAATVIKLDALKKVSKADQELLTKVERGQVKTLRKQVRKDNESATKQMERKGVTITQANAEMLAGFDKAAQAVWKELTGKVFTKAELEMVLNARDEYRAKYPVK